MRRIKRLVFQKIPRTAKTYLKVLLVSAMHLVGRHPQLKQLALKAIDRIPPLKARLVGLLRRNWAASLRQAPIPELAHLTPRARQIYTDLKKAIRHRHGDID